MDQDQALAAILEKWLARPESERTEAKLLSFAFDVAADPRFTFTRAGSAYAPIKEHLLRHGQVYAQV